MVKYLFFDIDGTLVSFNTHKIPQSTVDALTQAKANGLKVYISTGRPMLFINNLGQIEHLIDGYITTTGALCVVGQTRFNCHRISATSVRRILDGANKFHKAAVVVGTDHIGVVNDSEELTKQFKVGLNLDFDFAPMSVVMKEPILQISVFFNAEEEKDVMDGISDCVSSRWHPSFTDITNVSADKGKGIEEIPQGFRHYLSEGLGRRGKSQLGEDRHGHDGACPLAHLRFLLSYQQHCPSRHLCPTLLHPYHETRWSLLGIHT